MSDSQQDGVWIWQMGFSTFAEFFRVTTTILVTMRHHYMHTNQKNFCLSLSMQQDKAALLNMCPIGAGGILDWTRKNHFYDKNGGHIGSLNTKLPERGATPQSYLEAMAELIAGMEPRIKSSVYNQRPGDSNRLYITWE